MSRNKSEGRYIGKWKKHHRRDKFASSMKKIHAYFRLYY